VVIKNHVIVGTRSIVFPGVTLAEGTSIGAMSLVVKNTSPWKIYFGVPAVIISDRKKKVLELETNYLKKYFKY
jgi:galactoside O-acetyltransferase